MSNKSKKDIILEKIYKKLKWTLLTKPSFDQKNITLLSQSGSSIKKDIRKVFIELKLDKKYDISHKAIYFESLGNAHLYTIKPKIIPLKLNTPKEKIKFVLKLVNDPNFEKELFSSGSNRKLEINYNKIKHYLREVIEDL